MAKGELPAAITQYQQALAIMPALASARNNLGKALLQKGDFEAAIACFDDADGLRLDPFTRWSNLGNRLLQKNDLDSAIACFQQAIKINPQSADAYGDLGAAFFQQGKAGQAIDCWQKALEIAPDNLNVQNNLAWLLATTTNLAFRNASKAVALAAQASQLSSGANPVILHTLASAYAAQGNFKLAADTARRALQLALAQKRDTLAATLQNDMRLYEAKKPSGAAAP
jgi:tetratricopeptide (TPR) repeat protein